MVLPSLKGEGGTHSPLSFIFALSPQSIFCKQLWSEVRYHHTDHCAVGHAEGMVPVSTGSSDPAEPAVHRQLTGKIKSAMGSVRVIAAFIRPEQAISSAYITKF